MSETTFTHGQRVRFTENALGTIDPAEDHPEIYDALAAYDAAREQG